MLGKLILHQKKKVEAEAEKARDFTFGTIDGLIDTIATVAGVAGATSNNFIIFIAGLSTILAEAASMGFGSYISSKIKSDILAAAHHSLREKPLHEALLYWISTLGGGLVILIPFALSLQQALLYSAAIAGFLLFALGIYISKLTRRGRLQSGIELAAFGIFAAMVTYFVGSTLAGFFMGS